MDDKPTRSWFQFRLSTWFVLVGILAWWLAMKPGVEFHARRGPPRSDSNWLIGIQQNLGPESPSVVWTLVFDSGASLFTAIALFALVGWKLTYWAASRWNSSRHHN